MIKRIMRVIGYVRHSEAENAAKEIAAAQCRNIQKYALQDFGTPIDKGAEQQSREWAAVAFKILTEGGGTVPELITPSDNK